METERRPAPRNRTLFLSSEEKISLKQECLHLSMQSVIEGVLDRIINQDSWEAVRYLPTRFVDLLFLDPPYNLAKSWNSQKFRAMSMDEYSSWIDSWLTALLRVLKPTASVYICGDWRSSPAIYQAASRHFVVRNRITWERDKGRGARTNWKNNSEDIWYCTVSDRYTFNVEAVKLQRKVVAPYKDFEGRPKDWMPTSRGDYRLTHPSNVWTDVTVPFWSMPENTEHPTQKPEKLLAKIILASSNREDIVLDPFLGSGTSAVVARKLGRRYVGIEIDETYCCLALKRLSLAKSSPQIQGYDQGVFWDRNTPQPTMGERPRGQGALLQAE